MAVESNKNIFECPYGRVETTAVQTLAFDENIGTQAYGVIKCPVKACPLEGTALRSGIVVGRTSDSAIKMNSINQLEKAAATQIGRCSYNNGAVKIIGPDSPAS